MMLRTTLTILAVPLVVAFWACDLFNAPVTNCPDWDGPSAIQVELLDAETGGYLAEIATGRVVNGDYVEEMYRFRARPPFDGPPPQPPYPYRYLIAEGNGPGSYDVVIETPGYKSWERRGVRVRSAGECGGVEQELFVVRLDRSD